MNRCAGLMIRVAFVAGIALWRIAPGTSATAVQAAGCAPIASPSADIAPSAGFSTPASVVASFDNARAQEGCSVALSIDQSTFAGLSPQQQMLALFNAERHDRGLGALQLDQNLLSQIDLNHSREMAQYGYFNHPSPINHPGPSHVFDRLTANSAISNGWTGLAENIAAGYGAAAAVYAYMYQDSGEAWGHRHNILGYNGSTFGAYNWVGVGYATGGKYGTYFTSDFLGSPNYSSPALDTTAPTLNQPTVISGSASTGGTVKVQVTGVSDSGASTGEAALTGVVFYANSVTMDGNGNANTVIGTQGSAGTWTATLSVPAGATIHAVAVDGSGNYTDCSIGSTSCASNTPPASQAALTLSAGSAAPGATVTASGSGFAANETVSLYWNSAGTTPIATATASASGAFSRSITIPSNAVTNTTGVVIAVGQTASDSASATIQVTASQTQSGPTITVNPTSGVHGKIVSLSGSGFRAGETVLLRWKCASATCTGFISLGYTRANTSGGFATSIRIPSVAKNTYPIGALGNTSHLFVTTTFTVTG